MRKLSELITQRSTLELTIACYVSATIVRLLVAILRGLNPPPPEGDEWAYYVGAMGIIEGLGYSRLWPDGLLRPSATQMPGASAFIGIGMLLFGKQPASAYLMAVLISSTSVPLMFIFAQRNASTGTAVLAALACILYPTPGYYSTTSLTDAFFIPILRLALTLTSTPV